MAPDSPWIGIDFGTSNSAVAYQDGGATRLVRFDGGAKTLPTTFFFDFDTHETLIGEPANQALLGGVEGRFMRALKRVLGTALMHEKRQILNQRLTFVDIIGTFLRRLRLQAEAELGQPCTRVVAGRPVVFHGDGDSREAQAEADLLACYEAAGFTEVRFCLEPAAAAIANGAAAERFGRMVAAMGGPLRFVEDWQRFLPEATVIREMTAETDGYVGAMQGEAMGLAVVAMGGGRQTEADRVDPSVGLSDVLPLGTRVRKGQPLLRIHAARVDHAQRAETALRAAIRITSEAPDLPPLLRERVG